MASRSFPAFQPFVLAPDPPRDGRPALGARLGRRLGALLGGEPEPAVVAERLSGGGAGALHAMLLRTLGAGATSDPQRDDRKIPDGPFLALVCAPVDAVGGGNRVEGAGLARLVRGAGAPVVPVFVSGEGRERRVRVGAPIPAARLAETGDDRALLAWLRLRAGLLRHRPVSPPASGPALAGAEPVAGEMAAELLAAEIEAIPRGQRLVETERFVVVQARAHQLPVCVREIGRLREIAFRAVGEGTGRPLDLDAHDRTYRHLVLYDHRARRIAGAYRFAPTDEVVPVFGRDGLYTSTLFRFAPGFPLELGPALELGRSFVREEYQRTFAPLLLLFRGLGAYLAANPRYRVLFGAVSVSASYSPYSRELIAAALGTPGAMHPLSSQVAPRHPLRTRRAVSGEIRRLVAATRDVAELSTLVSDVEPDARGLPVLLREYLKLGGRLLGWSVDPAFGSVLDGLVAVDLARTEPRLLEAYLGREPARVLRAAHAAGKGSFAA